MRRWVISKEIIIWAVGRTKADAPEIDGVIYVTTDGHLNPGDIVNVKVTANEEYDLVGRHVP